MVYDNTNPFVGKKSLYNEESPCEVYGVSFERCGWYELRGGDVELYGVIKQGAVYATLVGTFVVYIFIM